MKHFIAVIGVWTLSLLVCTALTIISFVQLDVPVALHFWDAGRFLHPLGAGLGATILLSAETAVILAIVLTRLARGHISAFAQTLAIACLSSISAYGINDHVLKPFFGVPAPAEVMHGVRHGFNIWIGSAGSSFPSGHMSLAAAFAGVFMRLYRVSVVPLCAVLLLAAVLLLVGSWHFLSDVIAGSFFGLSAGILAGEGWAAHLQRWSVQKSTQGRDQ